MTDFTNHLHKLVGASLDAPEVQSFLAKLDPSAQAVDNEGKTHWESHTQGLALQADTRVRRITTVYLYPEGVDDFHEYKGPLPASLNFRMSRDQVKAQLGRPPDISGERHDKWEHDAHGLVVQYKKSGPIRVMSLTGY
jgi:hypothetical protein